MINLAGFGLAGYVILFLIICWFVINMAITYYDPKLHHTQIGYNGIED